MDSMQQQIVQLQSNPLSMLSARDLISAAFEKFENQLTELRAQISSIQVVHQTAPVVHSDKPRKTKIVVVGTKGNQLQQLRNKLKTYHVELVDGNITTPSADAALVTKFVDASKWKKIKSSYPISVWSDGGISDWADKCIDCLKRVNARPGS